MFLRQEPRLQGPHVIFHAMCPINLRKDLLEYFVVFGRNTEMFDLIFPKFL